MAQDPNELLPVVDADDQVIGLEKRCDIHSQGFLHRAVSILVLNSQGEVYLQQRSRLKDTYPLKWTTSASGHVDPDETYLMAAVRELKEELDLEVGELRLLGKVPASRRTDYEFMEIYLTITDNTPSPDPVEIEKGCFFNLDGAWKLALDPETRSPSLERALTLYQRWMESQEVQS
jgi:16S rRNA (adenine1518-N6/adenine1519-N6)-dimethyltransferase